MQIADIRADLQQWHIHRQERIAQEHERYPQHERPYNAICRLNDAMTDTGHRTVTTVRQENGSLTNGPATVLQATKDSFLCQHTPTQYSLDTDTQAKVDRLPQVFNPARRRQLEKRPFTTNQVRRAMHMQSAVSDNKKPPATTASLRRNTTTSPPTSSASSPTASGTSSLGKRCPPPLQKGGLGQPGQLARRSLCSHGGQNRLDHPPAPHLPPPRPQHTRQPLGGHPGPVPTRGHLPPGQHRRHGPGGPHHRLPPRQDAFPNTPWLLLEAVWKRMGLPFYNFASGYNRTRKYTVRTGAGLSPFL